MRVVVVAGPDPGHCFPAIALCQRLIAAGDAATLLTGRAWLQTAHDAGVPAEELLGLDVTAADDDLDAGAKIHHRAARMATLNAPQIRSLAPDLVVSDVITAAGAWLPTCLACPGSNSPRTRCTGRRGGCRRSAAAWRRVWGYAVGPATRCCAP